MSGGIGSGGTGDSATLRFATKKAATRKRQHPVIEAIRIVWSVTPSRAPVQSTFRVTGRGKSAAPWRVSRRLCDEAQNASSHGYATSHKRLLAKLSDIPRCPFARLREHTTTAF